MRINPYRVWLGAVALFCASIFGTITSWSGHHSLRAFKFSARGSIGERSSHGVRVETYEEGGRRGTSRAGSICGTRLFGSASRFRSEMATLCIWRDSIPFFPGVLVLRGGLGAGVHDEKCESGGHEGDKRSIDDLGAALESGGVIDVRSEDVRGAEKISMTEWEGREGGEEREKIDDEDVEHIEKASSGSNSLVQRGEEGEHEGAEEESQTEDVEDRTHKERKHPRRVFAEGDHTEQRRLNVEHICPAKKSPEWRGETGESDFTPRNYHALIDSVRPSKRRWQDGREECATAGNSTAQDGEVCEFRFVSLQMWESAPGINITDRETLGRRLLKAARFGRVNDARTLLQNGADPNFFIGTEQLEPDPDVNDADELSWTPLLQAASGGRTATCALLINSGANVSYRDEFGATCLHTAADSGKTATCSALIDMGADLAWQTDPARFTPLHYAAMRGFKGTCSILVQLGADVSVRSVVLMIRTGESAVLCCCEGFRRHS